MHCSLESIYHAKHTTWCTFVANTLFYVPFGAIITNKRDSLLTGSLVLLSQLKCENPGTSNMLEHQCYFLYATESNQRTHLGEADSPSGGNVGGADKRGGGRFRILPPLRTSLIETTKGALPPLDSPLGCTSVLGF